MPISKNQMKQPQKNKLQDVTLPTFQVPWAGILSTIGGLRRGPQMYGMGRTMYLTMIRF